MRVFRRHEYQRQVLHASRLLQDPQQSWHPSFDPEPNQHFDELLFQSHQQQMDFLARSFRILRPCPMR